MPGGGVWSVVVLSILLLACQSGPPSIVLVSLDTLRADRLGAFGNTDGLTPNLDRFASEATIFTQAYSQANETCFSHASLFTGRYPSELGRLDQDFRLDDTTPVAASMLKAYGYHTGASVAGGFLDPVFGFSRGFDHYDSPVQWASLYHTFPLALDWLDTLPAREPFFLFVHGYDTHQRYLKPSPYGHAFTDPAYRGIAETLVQELDGTLRITDGVVRPAMTLLEVQSRTDVRFRTEQARARLKLEGAMSTESLRLVNDTDADYVRDVYDGSVGYADAMFGVFMAGLAERGVLDNAAVIVISDHGEGLGEDGLFNHRFGVGDPETHVPVMIRLPGGRNGGRTIDDLVELVDILPTLAELAGATPPASIRGRTLLPATRGEPLAPKDAAFTEGAFRMVAARTLKGRLTFAGLAPDSEWLDDVLEGVRFDSPGITTTAGLTEADKVDLRDRIVAWRRSLPPAPENTAITDPALKEELRARGYWGAN
jgi:arylsulfatase